MTPAPPMPPPPSPPRKNYVIAVTARDPSDNLLNNAKVRVKDDNLGEFAKDKNTTYVYGLTNVSGLYVNDLANLPSAFSNGEKVVVSVEARGFRQTRVITVNTINPGEALIFDRSTATYVQM